MTEDNNNPIITDIDNCINSESFQKMLLMYFFIYKQLSQIKLVNVDIYKLFYDKINKKYKDVDWMTQLEFFDRISNSDAGELLYDKKVNDTYAYELDKVFYKNLLLLKKELVETLGILKSDLSIIGVDLSGF